MGYYLSIVFCVASRLIPHPANVTPLGSLVFLNARKTSPLKGVMLALVVMVISDIFLGFNYATPFVYLGFTSYAFLGHFKKLNPVAAVLLGSLMFFVISNFGVWIGPWYDHTLSGLISCFVNAVPFFRNMLVGDLVFVTTLVIAQRIVSKINLNFNYNIKEIPRWHKKLSPANLKKK